MNPYQRFHSLPNLIAAVAILGAVVAFGPMLRALAAEVMAGSGKVGMWALLAGLCAILVILWGVMAEIVLPAILKLGGLRRLVLGSAYVEGSWIQAERGGPNGPRIAIVSLKPSRNGLLLSSTSLTRSGEAESGIQTEFYQLSWPHLEFKFRETLPADSGKQAEGIGEIQFDLTGGAPKRYSGCLQTLGADKRVKTEGIKLTSWRERRHLRSLEGRRDVLAKYWAAFYEGPIVTVARSEEGPRFGKSAAGREREEGGIVPRRRATDWRKSDTTPTADRIRDEIASTSTD
ncbi:hypothetical protein [Hyphomonas pacifica]|uniref:SMODS-associating 2TM beta-strand rich effector domain-containing protein n=1 Tax=Hyphomonas pacifica TaxID=1280941 RepID=A0A062TNB3_9PROT|nr:hypothetical protein [Hyphomonas pacifica]KCZ46254.1 hypothetical protein HY2_06110 [Hyphomonas pacifica]RAN35856.1 hypothetical protein HY3_07085 [Hyphomonas pacifica]